jgi:hypothetical protein
MLRSLLQFQHVAQTMASMDIFGLPWISLYLPTQSVHGLPQERLRFLIAWPPYLVEKVFMCNHPARLSEQLA